MYREAAPSDLLALTALDAAAKDVVSVKLVECYGEWFVLTSRGEQTLALTLFDSEGYAADHAERQRQRLGLATVSQS